jgi:hypothetical protein
VLISINDQEAFKQLMAEIDAEALKTRSNRASGSKHNRRGCEKSKYNYVRSVNYARYVSIMMSISIGTQ